MDCEFPEDFNGAITPKNVKLINFCNKFGLLETQKGCFLKSGKSRKITENHGKSRKITEMDQRPLPRKWEEPCEVVGICGLFPAGSDL
jgi:hypothetical protein